MKKTLTKLFRQNLKALMLVMMTSFLALSSNAQIFTTDIPPSNLDTKYVGEDTTYTFEATGFDDGAQFILYYNAFMGFSTSDATSQNYVLGTSTVQDAEVTFDFSWPTDGNYDLELIAIAGDDYSDNLQQIEVTQGETTQIGSYGDGDFYRAGARSLTTNSVDLATSDTVTLSFDFEDYGVYSVDSASIVKVYYSINGGSTFTALVESGADNDTIANSGTKFFGMPSEALTSSTIFKIEQNNSSGLTEYEKNWEISSSLTFFIGEQYSVVTTSSTSYTVANAGITVLDIWDASDVSTASVYPGDDVKVIAELPGVDLTGYNFTAYVKSGVDSYLLLDQVVTFDNDSILVDGTIPTDLSAYGAYTISVVAYDLADSDPILGLSYNAYNDTDLLEVTGGDLSLSSATFSKVGTRSFTTGEIDVNSSIDASLTIELSRANNLISPTGTGLVIEFTNDGSTYTELGTYELNELGYFFNTTFVLAGSEWPSGFVSSTTQIRVRQVSNNGAGLDAWNIGAVTVSGETNLVSIITEGPEALTINRPAITLNALDISANNLPYPMTELDFTYTIDMGAFASGTEAMLMMNRINSYDLILATIADVSTETIAFKVPSLESGDYTLYLLVNGETYSSVSLPIYDLGLAFTSITADPSVAVAGEDYALPGAELTVTYSFSGTPGADAELVLSVRDDDFTDPDDEYVFLAASSTFDGTIVATLPTDINFGATPTLQLSVASGVFENVSVYSNNLINQSTLVGELPEEFFESGVGLSTYTYPDAFSLSGARSVTSTPMDFSLGGYLFLYVYAVNYTSDFTVGVEFSTDGENWDAYDDVEFTGIGSETLLNAELPSEYWSDSFQFRIVYEDQFAAGVNVSKVSYVQITSPDFIETTGVTQAFNYIKPSLDVEPFTADFVIGEEFSFNYNAQNFAAGTEYVAVIEQGNAYTVIGTSDGQNASSISGTMPILIPLDEDNPTDDYNLKIVPFVPATAGGDYLQGLNISLDDESAFLTMEGDDDTDYSSFNFDQTGERVLLTDAIDLSSADAATLNFTFNDIYATIDVLSNKNLVPRLEVSTDGGATFSVIPVYELADGEEQVYDDGLLYLKQTYNVDIPAEYITDATHFRWRQPLNLGSSQNAWSLGDISVDLDRGNEMSDALYTTTSNIYLNIGLNTPSLTNYLWSQEDLDDAVFNGESFNYYWGVDDEFVDIDTFPAGTVFIFTLDGTEDPQTGDPYIIGTSTSLGVAEATLPVELDKGSYQVNVLPVIEIDGVTYPLFKDGSGDPEPRDTGADLAVFNRAVKVTYSGASTDVIYAGSTVTFNIDLENDETSLASFDDVYANLLALNFDGGDDLILATQLGIDDITLDLPPYLSGSYTFKVVLTEGLSLGEAGDIGDYEGDGADLDLDDESFFIKGGIYSAMVETTDFYEYNFNSYDFTYLRFDYDFDPVASTAYPSATEYMRVEYSRDGGATWSNYTNFSGPTDGTYSLYLNYNDVGYNGTWERLRFRWFTYDAYASTTPTDNGSYMVIDNIYLDNSSFPNPLTDSYFQSNPINITYAERSGRGLLTTRDFTPAELDSKALLSFNLTFGAVPADLPENQLIVFEYSLDKGATYTQWDVLGADSDTELVSEFFDNYYLTDEMKASGVRFRFRQEERNGINVSFSNMTLEGKKSLPFDYVTDDLDVSEQVIMITGAASNESCYYDEVTLNYEVRGRFGVDNEVELEVIGESGSAVLDEVFNIVEGTGTVTFTIPSDFLDGNDDNEWLSFVMDAYDATNEDYDYSISGGESEPLIELVAPINQGISLSWDDPLECSSDEVIITLNGEQNYFMYEILNAADESVLGSLTYDPEIGDDEINIGMVSEDVTVMVRTTSMTSAGTVCNTFTSSETEDIEVQLTYKLFRRSYNNTSLKVLVAPGETRTICGSSSEVRLSVNRTSESSDGSSSFVEWFRNDISTPVSISGSVLGDGETLVSGDYFARVTETSGSSICTYLTESFNVVRAETPDRPVVTVESGDLSFCDGEGEVVLAAPEGFAYYKWNSDQSKTGRMLTVDQAGSYYVEVSNVPFHAGCGSSTSIPVVVESQYLPDFKVKTTPNSNDQYNITDGSSFYGCETFYIYFYDGNSYQNNSGEVVISKDGVFYASTQAVNYALTESGDYTIDWVSSDLNSSCTASIGTFSLEINAQPETPGITAGGPLAFCEGETVTLTATAGHAYYRWYRSGSLLSNNSSTLTVRKYSGRYQVEVSDVPFNVGCESELSPGVNVTVYAEPSMSIYSNAWGNFEDGDVFELCSADDDYYLRSYNSSGLPMTWYLDGAAIEGDDIGSSGSQYSYIYPTQSGAYHAEVTMGDVANSCVFATDVVNVVYSVQPNAVSIAVPAVTEFCSNEVSVTLTADAGASFYRWYLNDSPITDGTGNTNTLTVTKGGEYTVRVAESEGCESERSNIVTIIERSLPSTSISVSTFESDCATGDVTLAVSSTNSKYVYQLYNRETGEAMGSPFTGRTSGTVYVPLAGLTESTPLMAEISYADGSSCTSTNTSVGTASPNGVVLELDGSTLQAVISGSYLEYTWYRNGVKMRNAGGTSITVTDAATYSFEVTFVGGCTVTSSSIDLSSAPAAGRSNASNGRIVANTFPNPSTDVVNVEIPGDNFGVYRVQIMTLSGQVVISGEFTKGQEIFTERIDISSLEKGIYNMMVVKGKQVENIRIVKQ